MGAYHDSNGRWTQTETGYIDIDLADLVDDAGAAIGDWTDEANPTFGFDLTNSEAFGIRWNAHATPGAAMFKFRAPRDRKPAPT